MVRPEVFRKRLNKLDEYLAVLENLRQVDRQTFKTHPQLYGSAERFLHLAIETVLDMGNHLIADENLGVVNHYSDIPALLADKGYIPADLAQRWTRMIGFRNILVHDYLDIDRDIVYQTLQNNLADFEQLKRFFARFL
ncbi:MAG: DUF86 domain-containing protein [Chloroflexi bacterium]|nr:MAG: DUF86 domain-containing protein [Chloroflexota bacterium]